MRRALYIAGIVCLSLAVAAQTEAPCVAGGESIHVVQRGDTLGRIAARYGARAATIAAENALPTSKKLTSGQQVRVSHPHLLPGNVNDGIIINIPQRMLFLFKAGQLVHAYPVAVGKSDWQTPLAELTIVRKEKDPVWHVPESIQEEMARNGQKVKTMVPHCPSNPLGEFYMALSNYGVGIHGTSSPGSIYSFGTHGCIRLHPEDINELFSLVDIGTPVHIIYSRVMLKKCGDAVLLEVHPDIYRKQPATVENLRKIAASSGLETQIDWQKVSLELAQPSQIAVDVTTHAPREMKAD